MFGLTPVRRTVVIGVLSFSVLTACNFPFAALSGLATPDATAALADLPTLSVSEAVVTSSAIPTLVPTKPIVTNTPIVSLTDTPNAASEPVGCLRPSDDYGRVLVNGNQLNKRTLGMLRHAQELYGGTIDFAGWAVTQGSYNPGAVKASFGTHDGGGAVDLSVVNPKNGRVLRDEFPAAIRALRIAGFAAWVREINELYNGSPIHIHAIAIGDAELSPAAQEQLTGRFAYFRGYNGLPTADNIPIADRHGGPIFCKWMIDMGYKDLRH